MKWLVIVGVYALIGAYWEEAANWLSAEYAETVIYQILEVVVSAVVLTGLGALIIGLAIGAISYLIIFVAIVICSFRSRDPWTG